MKILTPADALESLIAQLKDPADIESVLQWWSVNMGEFTAHFFIDKRHEDDLAAYGRFDEHFSKQVQRGYQQFAEVCYNQNVGVVREEIPEPDEKGPNAYPWWERERRFQIKWFVFKPRVE